MKRYFKRPTAILVEFLPRILFFWPLFGYLIALMFVKWANYGAVFEERNPSNFKIITSIHSKHLRCLGPYQSDCAPSILITFINMMLLQYGEDKTTPPVDSCETVFFYSGQKELQIAFLLIAVISVPVLLFGTPILFCYTHKKKGVVRTKLYFYEIRSCVTYLPQNEPSGSSSNESLAHARKLFHFISKIFTCLIRCVENRKFK